MAVRKKGLLETISLLYILLLRCVFLLVPCIKSLGTCVPGFHNLVRSRSRPRNVWHRQCAQQGVEYAGEN